MIARGPSLHRILSCLVVVLLVAGSAAPPVARAIEPPNPGPLDRPIVDVVLIDPPEGSDGPPLLLTLDEADLPAGTVRIALLDRSNGWQPVASETVTLAEPRDGSKSPWLIEVGAGRFAILLASRQAGMTAVQLVTVRPDADQPIELGALVRFDLAVDDAGAIDVDGDGTTELVVASATTTRGGGTCQSSEIRVLDATTLAERARYAVPDMRLAGAVLGEWDGEPGGDLLAYTYGNCPAGPDSAQRLGLLTLRLRDGTPTVAISPGDPSGSLPLPGVPLAADLDGDGVAEVVVRDGDVLVIVEPSRGWARTEFARGNALPIAVVGANAADRGIVTWLEYSDDNDLTVATATVVRGAGGSLDLSVNRLDLDAASAAERSRVLRAYQDMAIGQANPQAWVGDIDADGCPEVLAPLLIVECTREADPSTRIGAAWMATRPIGVYDVRNRRELLIAATMAWYPVDGSPRAATPAASGPAGAWRHGPSVRFALSEVRAADALYFSNFPVPRPTIERGPIQAQSTDLPGFTGVRVIVRAIAIGPDAPADRDPPTLDAFLRDPVQPRELVGVGRIPVPATAESGRDGSFLRLPLGGVETADGLPPSRWVVTIAQINDWGEISGPVRQTLELDIDGPSLVVETPFLSPPWPFEATIRGRSEPEIEIQGGTGGAVLADRRGRFELKTQLAPWPQTLELTAIDKTGNRTSKRFTLVGGVDYRDFPWAGILAGVLLLAAFLSAGRGSVTKRDVETLPDAEPMPEIEELPTAGEWPRA